MEIYWKDILDDTNSWSGLSVTIKEKIPRKPIFRIESTHNQRFKIISNRKTFCWATIAKEYCGVWLVKKDIDDSKISFPLKPISSDEVEQRVKLNRTEKLKSWSRYLISCLQNSNHSFLYNGMWLIEAYVKKNNSNWQFESVGKQEELSYIYHSENKLQQGYTEWIDWWLSGSGEIITFKSPEKESGRVKWWRKKIKENNLPPIFLWYLSSLDAYIVIDDHSRLLASYLENQEPDFIAISSVKEVEIQPDKRIKKSIIYNLNKQKLKKNKRLLSTIKENAILIQAFDDRPFYHHQTKAWNKFFFNEWDDEVCKYLQGKADAAVIDSIMNKHCG